MISKYLSLFQSLDSHTKEVIRGSGVSLIVRLLGAGFSFGFNVLIGRYLGVEGAGIYFLALSVVAISATIGRFGLENTLLRLISSNVAKGDWGTIKALYYKGMSLSFTVAMVITLVLFFTAPLLANFIFNKPELTTPLRLMSLSIIPVVLLFLHAEALKGIKQIRDSQLLNGCLVPLLSCLLLFLAGKKIRINDVIVLYLLSTILVTLGGIWLWHKKTPKMQHVAMKNLPERLILESCIPLLWVAVMSMMINWSSMFFMGIWGTKVEIGMFGAALRIAMLTSFVLTSVNSIVAPKFAALYSLGDFKGLATVAQKSTLIMIIAAFPFLLVFVTFPDSTMGFFGKDFTSGGLLLIILAIGQFINVCTGSVGYLLMMTGHERLMRANTICVGVGIIVLNLCLVPTFGAVGAAIATAVGMIALNIGAFYLVWKKLGIWTFPFFKPATSNSH